MGHPSSSSTPSPTPSACAQQLPVSSGGPKPVKTGLPTARPLRQPCHTSVLQSKGVGSGVAQSQQKRPTPLWQGQRRHAAQRLAALPPAAAAVTTAAGTRAQQRESSAGAPVAVVVGKTPNNSRRLFAEVDVDAPPAVVWGALTNYEGLDEFIPSLETNRCLERRPNGARLEQVGAQEVALGVKFSAKVVLDIFEYRSGLPAALCSQDHDEAKFPHPSGPYGASASVSLASSSTSSVSASVSSLDDAPAAAAACPRDIAFSMVESRDFQAFRGVWRIAPGSGGPATCKLSYALFVRPQVWLPVQLVQSRIEAEVKNNLNAVRAYAQGLHHASMAEESEMEVTMDSADSGDARG